MLDPQPEVEQMLFSHKRTAETRLLAEEVRGRSRDTTLKSVFVFPALDDNLLIRNGHKQQDCQTSWPELAGLGGRKNQCLWSRSLQWNANVRKTTNSECCGVAYEYKPEFQFSFQCEVMLLRKRVKVSSRRRFLALVWHDFLLLGTCFRQRPIYFCCRSIPAKSRSFCTSPWQQIAKT